MDESVAALRAAYLAIDEAATAHPDNDRLRWVRRELFDLLRDEWFSTTVLRSGVVAEALDLVLAEVGSKLSAKSREAISAAIELLEELLASYRQKVSQPELVSEAARVLVDGAAALREAAGSDALDGPADYNTDLWPNRIAALSRENGAPAGVWAAYYALKDGYGETVANKILVQNSPMFGQRAALVESLKIEDSELQLRHEEVAALALSEAELTTAARKRLPAAKFADPENRKYPIHDKAHADNAMARLEQQWKAGKIEEAYYKRVKARIRAAQRRFGEEPEEMKESAPALPLYIEDMQQLPEGTRHLGVSTATLFAEAEGSSAETPRFMMAVIAAGMSGNRVFYPPHVLAEAAPLLDGKPIYIDHPDKSNPTRSLRSKAGWWDSPQFVENMQIGGQPFTGIIARVNLFSKDANPAPWLEGMIRESIAAGRPDLVGISIWAAGPAEIKRDSTGGLYREAQKIVMFGSADAVAEPGARGQALFAASKHMEDPVLSELEKLTLDDLTAGRPDLVEALRTKFAESGNPAAGPDQQKKDDAPPTQGAVVHTQFQESVEAINRMRMEMYLDRALEKSSLNDPAKALVRKRIGNSIFSEAQIDDIIKEYSEIISSVPKPDPTPNRMLTSGVSFPIGAVLAEQMSPLEQAYLALCDFFHCTIPDDKKGKFPKIHSFREFYAGITGDTLIDGKYDLRRAALADYWHQPIERFAEALPTAGAVVGGGTITMSNLLGLSMNRRLTEVYQSQPQWWRPIVSTTTISNFKQQQRVRLHNFGSLTERTVDGEEYTELLWGETQETYTATEYGNVVSVGRRAIINDDLDGIRRIPTLLGVSAAVTINEYVANLFTQNSGNGPTMADGVQVFNAASHQGNRITDALSQTSVINARTILQKMTNDAGKRIGVVARYLLVPADLEVEAWKLVVSPLEPNNANNARNMLADGDRGLRAPISVPQFSDPNNWYLMADPAQLACIEMGFLFGREDPEFFQQTDPGVGAVFTNDVIMHKIRHDYGGGWIDYRGAVGSIVAGVRPDTEREV